MNRTALSALALFALLLTRVALAQTNVAPMATPSTSFVSGHETLGSVNDGFEPRNANDHTHGAYGNWPQHGTHWVELTWDRPISTNKIDVYWWVDGQGVRLPTGCRLLYWNGSALVPVPEAQGFGVEQRRYNTTSFPEISTTRMRLEFDSTADASTGIIEWRVYDSGKSPNFAPTVSAGKDRIVVMPAKTFLASAIRDDGKPQGPPTVTWSKASGPGDVTFEDPSALATAATFSAPGNYVLKLTASDSELSGASTVSVTVQPAATIAPLTSVLTRQYTLNSPLWNDRIKMLMVNWIPHCYQQISDLNLREGGINNFIQAGNKLAGKPFTPHVGYMFSNAWVYNTIEAMSVGLMLDPQGDQQIIDAQKEMRAKLAEWIPIILAAQEPDGYLQTRFTLGRANERTPAQHWDTRTRGEHEGYVAGYFIECAIAHYIATDGKDRRLYDAAIRLADCWDNNLGPTPKKAWFDGHQEMEMALVRLGRFVNEIEGNDKGQKYIVLAKFLLDCRGNGSEYDQSHVPVIRQYEAVGHSVRAAYNYAAMTDIVLETHDAHYHSAVLSLEDNIVNRKYYVTGGIGSGETSEGFGPDYSLRNNAYCESCANIGQLFFQHKLHLLDHESEHVDLYETTLYNAVLGDLDLEGRNFYYQNPLESARARYAWHNCPCCVGNIARVLLMLPTWAYSKGTNELLVNLYIGSTATVQNIAGTNVQMIQKTDYPWKSDVSITVNPDRAASFALRLRVPGDQASDLYRATPGLPATMKVSVNGAAAASRVEKGYVVIEREWKAGDRVEFQLPLMVQRIKSSDKITGNRGRVALKYGPLIYNIEAADQNVDSVLPANSALTTEFDPMLGGITAIKGKFADGSAMTAIPNHVRNNRGGRSIVWIKDE